MHSCSPAVPTSRTYCSGVRVKVLPASTMSTFGMLLSFEQSTVASPLGEGRSLQTFFISSRTFSREEFLEASDLTIFTSPSQPRHSTVFLQSPIPVQIVLASILFKT